MPHLEQVYSSRYRGRAEYVAEDVAYLTVGFANVYFVGTPGGEWVLVDTGLPRTSSWIHRVAVEVFGSVPEAIVLTHGHIDHAGNAAELAQEWRVPVYAHRLELPYLKGRSDYPPSDSSMGGAIAHLARVIPTTGIDLGRRVRALPEDGSVPGLPDWQWIHTPGHTAGHISLFRESDRVLIAGDAVATMDLDSWASVTAETAHVARPPAPLTTDWEAAHAAVIELHALRPAVLAAGHGRPVFGSGIEPALRALATDFPVPLRGRYRLRPAVTDESGVVEVPPPVRDPYPALVLGAALGAFLAVGVLSQRKRGWAERLFG